MRNRVPPREFTYHGVMTFLDYERGLEISALHSMYPSRLWTPKSETVEVADPTRTSYGLCLEGTSTIRKTAFEVTLSAGMYFAVTGPYTISGTGKTVVIDRYGYRGLDQIGGPIEENGRLTYIDDCRASILVNPARLGDPVFNLLTFPPRILQTVHIHPTVRLGAVVKGVGRCHLPGGITKELRPGMVFMLDEGERHGFESLDQSLIVVAYHPDSDTGPTDSNHPMLNRTYVTDGGKK